MDLGHKCTILLVILQYAAADVTSNMQHQLTMSSNMHYVITQRHIWECVYRLARIVSPLLWRDLSASCCWHWKDVNISSVHAGIPDHLWSIQEHAQTSLGNIVPITVSTLVKIIRENQVQLKLLHDSNKKEYDWSQSVTKLLWHTVHAFNCTLFVYSITHDCIVHCVWISGPSPDR